MKQYPHKMILTVETGTVQDANGDWVPGTPEIIEQECRAEPSGGNGYISTPGGTKINYGWIVYMPLPAAKIQPGTIIEVQDPNNADETILKDKVLQFNRSQQNARLWL
jgi:hypothetical protein